jgi:hypothetical protein
MPLPVDDWHPRLCQLEELGCRVTNLLVAAQMKDNLVGHAVVEAGNFQPSFTKEVRGDEPSGSSQSKR